MAKKRQTETEEQARARIEAEVLADPAYSGETASSPDVVAAVEARLASWRSGNKQEETKGLYEWLDQLPPDYLPPSRILAGTSPGFGIPGRTVYNGRGLVDGRGQFVRNPDGTIKTLYGAADVQSVWRGIGYTEKKEIAKYMKAFNIYGGSSPSLNLDQIEDFNAFARVLYTANNEGVSWDVALEILAKRYQDLPKGPAYKPTSIADIRRAIQQQATNILGRGLLPKEAGPLAKQIQRQEVQQRTTASGEQPVSTSTLIEEGVQKQFAPEIQAYNFARFAQMAMGLAGGVRRDPELETISGA